MSCSCIPIARTQMARNCSAPNYNLSTNSKNFCTIQLSKYAHISHISLVDRLQGHTKILIYQIIVKPWRKKFLATAKLLDGSNYQLGVKSPRPIFTNMCSDFEGIYLTSNNKQLISVMHFISNILRSLYLLCCYHSFADSINKNMQPGINATKTNILHLQESYTSTYISFFFLKD